MKLSKEEIYLRKMERENLRIMRNAEKERLKEERMLKKAERLAEKLKLEAEKQARKEEDETPEEVLVHRYVNRVIRNSQYHGRVDPEKYKGLVYDKTISKDLWLDTDFFFSVVFQSRRQKLEFMEKWTQMHTAVDTEIPGRLQIVNGLKLAKALGIELSPETSMEYPTGQMDLLPFIMDFEVLK